MAEASEPTDLLAGVYSMEPRRAVFEIMLSFDRAYSEGRFDDAERALDGVDLDRLPRGAWHAVAVVSYWGRAKISNHEKVWRAVRDKFRDVVGEVEASRLLDGLR